MSHPPAPYLQLRHPFRLPSLPVLLGDSWSVFVQNGCHGTSCDQVETAVGVPLEGHPLPIDGNKATSMEPSAQRADLDVQPYQRVETTLRPIRLSGLAACAGTHCRLQLGADHSRRGPWCSLSTSRGRSTSSSAIDLFVAISVGSPYRYR